MLRSIPSLRPDSVLPRALAILILATSPATAAVLGDIEISHPSGTNPYGFEELLFADVADQVVGPISNESPTASTVASQGAFGESLLSAGAIGLAGSTAVETLGFGTLYRSSAGAEVRYDEQLTVSSTTLPAGTPVDVSILYAVAGDVFTFHDLAASVVANQTQQQADAVVTITVRVEPAGGGQQRTDSYLVSSVGGTSYQTGAFADPGGVDLLTVPTTVGSTVRLRITASVRPNSRAQPYQLTLGQPLVLPLAVADGALGVAFGIEASLADVDVVSPLLGGTFPGFDNATLQNATAVLPALPVPEPAVLPALAIGTLALARRSRSSRRSPTDSTEER